MVQTFFAEITGFYFPLGSNTQAASHEKSTAPAIPPAADFNPPVNMPRNPVLSISSITPFARLYPKPVSGTVAPAPAKSTKIS